MTWLNGSAVLFSLSLGISGFGKNFDADRVISDIRHNNVPSYAFEE
jgi:hypothetical protein